MLTTGGWDGKLHLPLLLLLCPRPPTAVPPTRTLAEGKQVEQVPCREVPALSSSRHFRSGVVVLAQVTLSQNDCGTAQPVNITNRETKGHRAFSITEHAVSLTGFG